MHPPTTETMYIGDKELKNTRENAVKQQRQVEGCHVPSLLGSPLGADELKLRTGEGRFAPATTKRKMAII